MELASFEKNDTNVTVDRYVSSLYNLTQEDSNWIVTSSFMIFTMQTGNTKNNIFSEKCMSYSFRHRLKYKLLLFSLHFYIMRVC